MLYMHVIFSAWLYHFLLTKGYTIFYLPSNYHKHDIPVEISHVSYIMAARNKNSPMEAEDLELMLEYVAWAVI